MKYRILYFMRRTAFKYYFLSAFLLLTCFIALGQDKSNRGKEFWMAYGFDYSFFHESPVNNQELALYISTQLPANVTVTVTNTGYTQILTIPANTVDASILIPKSGLNDARTLTDGLQNKGIHIVSDVPVAVYAHVYSTMVSGATMLMPVETYGYLYHSINYSQNTSASPLPTILPTIANGNDWYSWFYAIATEDNTRLEITPSDTTKNGWLPGQTYTVNLNKGESYHVFGKLLDGNSQAWAASKDMTGSKIVSVIGGDGSCHPVAVFSGSGGIRLCRGDGGEFVHQQVFPAQAWGTRYLTYHTINNTSTNILETNRNYYRICVSDPAAVVRKNGVVMTGLTNNFYYEYMDSTGGDYITSDRPILVAQYTPNKNQCWNYPVTTPAPPSYGDPEMFYLSPIEQGQKAVLFYTSRKSSIDYVYTNILVSTAGVSSLKVDGVSLPPTQIIPHPNNPAYSVALARLIGAAAQHTITSDSTFTATVYGLGNYESYGYNVGTLINNLNSYSKIKNTYNTSGNVDTFTCPKTPVRLFVKVGYPATSITWKLSTVPGISPNADSIIINPIPATTETINGRTYYVYTLQQDFIFANPGTFYIPVTFTAAVIANCGQTENATVKVVVNPGPAANFSISAANCLNDTLFLNSTSATNGFNIVGYMWNFDDATTQTTSNATKRFNAAGIQNVRYRIYADNGCAGDTTKQVNILPSPISKLGVTSPVCLKESTLISDTSTTSTGTITNWRYLIEPLPFATVNRNVNTAFPYIFNAPGNFRIGLITTASNGCLSDTVFKTVVVLPKAIATFSYDKNICLGDSIKFTDISSFASGTITSWKWLMGDGNTRTFTSNAPFYHKYNTTGAFTVSLIVTGNNGCVSDTFNLPVTVNNKPVASITGIGKACIDSNFIFTSSMPYSTTNPANWYWSFGDGQIQNITSTNIASHVYSSALTNIIVKHSVSFGPGCYSDTAFLTIPVININPAAVPFTLSNTVICEQSSVQISTTAPTTGISNWLWNFGNGTGTQVPPFVRPYNNAGNFTISLVVSNAGGCNSPVTTNSVTVHPIPVINAGTDKQISTGASVNIDATISTSPANISYLWTPATSLSSATILNPVATPSANITYTLRATDNNTNCYTEDSVKIIVISKLFIPNAFSPNGDGLNDTWNIPAMILYPDATVTVFNRYGEIIYETKNYISKPWNGSYRGKQQPNDTYVYVIKFASDKFEKGTVTIVR